MLSSLSQANNLEKSWESGHPQVNVKSALDQGYPWYRSMMTTEWALRQVKNTKFPNSLGVAIQAANSTSILLE